MKLKSKLRYLFFKTFPEKYIKFFNRSYDHKLNHNLLDLLKKGLKIDVIFDIGAFRGEWSKLLNKTSLKNKNFYLFEANEENREYLKKSNLNKANFSFSNLSNADISETNLVSTNLHGSNLKNVNFTNANLLNADLSSTLKEGTIFCNTIMPDGTLNNSGC